MRMTTVAPSSVAEAPVTIRRAATGPVVRRWTSTNVTTSSGRER